MYIAKIKFLDGILEGITTEQKTPVFRRPGTIYVDMTRNTIMVLSIREV